MGAYENLLASIYEGDAIEQVVAPEPLVEGMFDTQSIGMIYGRPGIGKSAVMQGLSLAIATGQPDWCGLKLTRDTVLYVIAEGASGMGIRHSAWKAWHQVSGVTGLHYMTVAPNLLIPEDRLAILRIAQELDPGLTILDTLARHIPGADENTGPGMSLVIETMEALRRLGGSATAVHHSGLADASRSRGHSSLEGAVDHSIALLDTKDGKMRLHAHKHKNHRDGIPIARLKMQEVAGSIVVVADDSLTQPETLTLATLVSLSRETVSGNGSGIKSHAWQTACERIGISRASFFRYRTKLLGLEEVCEINGQYQVSSESHTVS